MLFAKQFERRSRFATGESEGVYYRTRLSERPSKAREQPVLRSHVDAGRSGGQGGAREHTGVCDRVTTPRDASNAPHGKAKAKKMVGTAAHPRNSSLKLKTVCQNRNLPTFSRPAENISKATTKNSDRHRTGCQPTGGPSGAPSDRTRSSRCLPGA